MKKIKIALCQLLIEGGEVDRNFERAEEIIKRLGSMPRRSKGELPISKHRYFLSDSMGEMRCLYNVADIIVLGGSFFKSGGHNPIEPALAGKAIICGKSIFNINMGKGVLSKVVVQGDNLYIGIAGKPKENIGEGFTSTGNIITGKSQADGGTGIVQTEYWKEID